MSIRTRIAATWVAAGALWTGVGYLAVTVPERPAPRPVTERHCAAEDEVLVTVAEAAFDLQAGQPVCVHIDHLNINR